jgi:type I restriction enzyme, S subunit
VTGQIAARSRYPVVPYQYYARTGSGHTPARNVEEYWLDCEIPWVTTADVKHFRDGQRQVLQDTELHVSHLGLAHSAARLHPAGTVVLSRTASVGFSAIMGQPMATSQDFVTWTPKPALEPRYLLWVLRAMKGIGDLDRLMYGSTHKTIYVPDLQQLVGPLPPIEQQQRIADYLDTETARIDIMLRETSKLASLVRERWAAVVTAETNPTGAVAAALRYGVEGIYSGADFAASELSPTSGEGLLRYVRTTDIEDVDRLKHDGVYVERSALLSTQIVRDGDILVTRAGSLGTAYRHQGDDTAFAGYLVRIVPQAWSSEFLRFWVESKPFQEQVRVGAVRSTIDNFSASKYAALHVPVLGRAEQNEIVDRLSAELTRRRQLDSLLVEQSRLLRERRQSMITVAVTGELGV